MCGRYTLQHTPEEIAAHFKVEAPDELLRPRFNIAPSQIVPVIRWRDSAEMIGCKWGLVPFWAKDLAIGNKMINARAETLIEKPSFKRLLKSKRCLIPADGFYEWAKDGKKKQPMYIRRKDGDLFALAGLWEEWKAPDSERLSTCTIITTEPNELMAPIHNRMPVVLDRRQESAWLNDPADDPQKLLALLKPFDADQLEAYPVSTAVNSPATDEAGLIKAIDWNCDA